MSVQRSRKLCLALILFVFATSSRALAQDQPVVKPKTVGLSSERLERIGKTVQKDIDDKRIAGAGAQHERSRSRQAHADRLHLPHLLHDQAHHKRCRDDSLRRRQIHAR